jgi:hypothetical protein
MLSILISSFVTRIESQLYVQIIENQTAFINLHDVWMSLFGFQQLKQHTAG